VRLRKQLQEVRDAEKKTDEKTKAPDKGTGYVPADIEGKVGVEAIRALKAVVKAGAGDKQTQQLVRLVEKIDQALKDEENPVSLNYIRKLAKDITGDEAEAEELVNRFLSYITTVPTETIELIYRLIELIDKDRADKFTLGEVLDPKNVEDTFKDILAGLYGIDEGPAANIYSIVQTYISFLQQQTSLTEITGYNLERAQQNFKIADDNLKGLKAALEKEKALAGISWDDFLDGSIYADVAYLDRIEEEGETTGEIKGEIGATLRAQKKSHKVNPKLVMAYVDALREREKARQEVEKQKMLPALYLKQMSQQLIALIEDIRIKGSLEDIRKTETERIEAEAKKLEEELGRLEKIAKAAELNSEKAQEKAYQAAEAVNKAREELKSQEEKLKQAKAKVEGIKAKQKAEEEAKKAKEEAGLSRWQKFWRAIGNFFSRLFGKEKAVKVTEPSKELKEAQRQLHIQEKALDEAKKKVEEADSQAILLHQEAKKAEISVSEAPRKAQEAREAHKRGYKPVESELLDIKHRLLVSVYNARVRTFEETHQEALRQAPLIGTIPPLEPEAIEALDEFIRDHIASGLDSYDKLQDLILTGISSDESSLLDNLVLSLGAGIDISQENFGDFIGFLRMRYTAWDSQRKHLVAFNEAQRERQEVLIQQQVLALEAKLKDLDEEIAVTYTSEIRRIRENIGEQETDGLDNAIKFIEYLRKSGKETREVWQGYEIGHQRFQGLSQALINRVILDNQLKLLERIQADMKTIYDAATEQEKERRADETAKSTEQQEKFEEEREEIIKTIRDTDDIAIINDQIRRINGLPEQYRRYFSGELTDFGAKMDGMLRIAEKETLDLARKDKISLGGLRQFFELMEYEAKGWVYERGAFGAWRSVLYGSEAFLPGQFEPLLDKFFPTAYNQYKLSEYVDNIKKVRIGECDSLVKLTQLLNELNQRKENDSEYIKQREGRKILESIEDVKTLINKEALKMLKEASKHKDFIKHLSEFLEGMDYTKLWTGRQSKVYEDWLKVLGKAIKDETLRKEAEDVLKKAFLETSKQKDFKAFYRSDRDLIRDKENIKTLKDAIEYLKRIETQIDQLGVYFKGREEDFNNWIRELQLRIEARVLDIAGRVDLDPAVVVDLENIIAHMHYEKLPEKNRADSFDRWRKFIDRAIKRGANEVMVNALASSVNQAFILEIPDLIVRMNGSVNASIKPTLEGFFDDVNLGQLSYQERQELQKQFLEAVLAIIKTDRTIKRFAKRVESRLRATAKETGISQPSTEHIILEVVRELAEDARLKERAKDDIRYIKEILSLVKERFKQANVDAALSRREEVSFDAGLQDELEAREAMEGVEALLGKLEEDIRRVNPALSISNITSGELIRAIITSIEIARDRIEQLPIISLKSETAYTEEQLRCRRQLMMAIEVLKDNLIDAVLNNDTADMKAKLSGFRYITAELDQVRDACINSERIDYMADELKKEIEASIGETRESLQKQAEAFDIATEAYKEADEEFKKATEEVEKAIERRREADKALKAEEARLEAERAKAASLAAKPETKRRWYHIVWDKIKEVYQNIVDNGAAFLGRFIGTELEKAPSKAPAKPVVPKIDKLRDDVKTTQTALDETRKKRHAIEQRYDETKARVRALRATGRKAKKLLRTFNSLDNALDTAHKQRRQYVMSRIGELILQLSRYESEEAYRESQDLIEEAANRSYYPPETLDNIRLKREKATGQGIKTAIDALDKFYKVLASNQDKINPDSSLRELDEAFNAIYKQARIAVIVLGPGGRRNDVIAVTKETHKRYTEAIEARGAKQMEFHRRYNDLNYKLKYVSRRSKFSTVIELLKELNRLKGNYEKYFVGDEAEYAQFNIRVRTFRETAHIRAIYIIEEKQKQFIIKRPKAAEVHAQIVSILDLIGKEDLKDRQVTQDRQSRWLYAISRIKNNDALDKLIRERFKVAEEVKVARTDEALSNAANSIRNHILDTNVAGLSEAIEELNAAQAENRLLEIDKQLANIRGLMEGKTRWQLGVEGTIGVEILDAYLTLAIDTAKKSEKKHADLIKKFYEMKKALAVRAANYTAAMRITDYIVASSDYKNTRDAIEALRDILKSITDKEAEKIEEKIDKLERSLIYKETAMLKAKRLLGSEEEIDQILNWLEQSGIEYVNTDTASELLEGVLNELNRRDGVADITEYDAVSLLEQISKVGISKIKEEKGAITIYLGPNLIGSALRTGLPLIFRWLSQTDPRALAQAHKLHIEDLENMLNKESSRVRKGNIIKHRHALAKLNLAAAREELEEARAKNDPSDIYEKELALTYYRALYIRTRLDMRMMGLETEEEYSADIIKLVELFRGNKEERASLTGRTEEKTASMDKFKDAIYDALDVPTPGATGEYVAYAQWLKDDVTRMVMRLYDSGGTLSVIHEGGVVDSREVITTVAEYPTYETRFSITGGRPYEEDEQQDMLAQGRLRYYLGQRTQLEYDLQMAGATSDYGRRIEANTGRMETGLR
ncbi:MAG: hypothetical protein HQ572_05280, partial [Candidatus Omnitrophica bacterium]|nr:hypothetical protein [Candidatus Omnitrophota bacterium]